MEDKEKRSALRLEFFKLMEQMSQELYTGSTMDKLLYKTPHPTVPELAKHLLKYATVEFSLYKQQLDKKVADYPALREKILDEELETVRQSENDLAEYGRTHFIADEGAYLSEEKLIDGLNGTLFCVRVERDQDMAYFIDRSWNKILLIKKREYINKLLSASIDNKQESRSKKNSGRKPDPDTDERAVKLVKEYEKKYKAEVDNAYRSRENALKALSRKSESICGKHLGAKRIGQLIAKYIGNK